jgi:hypothetical protein
MSEQMLGMQWLFGGEQVAALEFILSVLETLVAAPEIVCNPWAQQASAATNRRRYGTRISSFRIITS